MTFSIFPCGTEVKLKRGNYEGVITAIHLHQDHINYTVSYFEGGSYRSNNFDDYEFLCSGDAKTGTVGFKP